MKTDKLYRVVTGAGDVLRFDRPECLVVALMACATQGIAYPTQPQLNWIAKVADVPLYDGSRSYFSPYGISQTGLFLKPWFRAAHSCLFSHAINCAGSPLGMLDPTDWRVNVANVIADTTMFDDVTRSLVQAALAVWIDPEGEERDFRDLMDVRVRQAMEAGSLVVDPKKARALLPQEVK